MIAYLFMNCYY